MWVVVPSVQSKTHAGWLGSVARTAELTEWRPESANTTGFSLMFAISWTTSLVNVLALLSAVVDVPMSTCGLSVVIPLPSHHQVRTSGGLR